MVAALASVADSVVVVTALMFGSFNPPPRSVVLRALPQSLTGLLTTTALERAGS